MNLAAAYKTAKAAKSFTHFIAESQCQQLVIGLNSVKLFFLDGTTNAGKIESELFLVAMFDKDGVNEKVLTEVYYPKVSTPSSVSFARLFDVFPEALRSVGIASVTGKDCSKLVGVATD